MGDKYGPSGLRTVLKFGSRSLMRAGGLLAIVMSELTFCGVAYSAGVSATTDDSVLQLRVQHDLGPDAVPRLNHVLRATEKLSLLHFGIHVRLILASGDSVSAASLQLGPHVLKQLVDQRIDGTSDSVLVRLRPALLQRMRTAHTATNTWESFVNAGRTQSKAGSPCQTKHHRGASLEDLADAVALQHKCWQTELKAASAFKWNAELAADDSFDQLKHEYRFWQYAAAQRLDTEVFVTQSLIASTEITETDVHSSLRGGISNGITFGSHLSRTKAVSILSLAPFFGTEKPLLELRAERKPYMESQAIEYAALMLTHELGHQLLRLGHPWSNPACIMRPPVRLHFRAWAKQLDPKRCKLGSEAAMTRNAIEP